MLMMMTMSDEVDGGGTGPPQAVLGTTGSGGNDGGVLVLDSGTGRVLVWVCFVSGSRGFSFGFGCSDQFTTRSA
ncbi:hypothetical protein HanRHA438_Chr14g0674461 [Helianthus annuus]|uniref:Uncharacterized protein n=2 Tax=Helianthus annuus TaxID=4232 RepID=A0A9K3H974_HELAN|nr:hypothetical protein HanXRQr2_Chr14g0663311 [Helianthus annuus]KAJ0661360.1 hypothetical protein HanOQP8_Chr14g0547721 [Helianthus annuus]KAJ0693417.1 hypothetical protein HanPI659440_Chr15g0596921 [Helianthus annuus]KAJ0841987.1 hypothetical protein HanPSC8_Chr14g0636581 [Helianthus annuus]KAJ0855537.1 hypothetical protein HanRHA438_Chr14g0674461 [Helianthus annuus]